MIDALVQSPNTKRKRPNYTLRRLGAAAFAAALAASTAFIGIKSYKTVHDYLTTDDITYSFNVNTYPTITDGAREAVKTMLSSNDPATREVAEHIYIGDVTRSISAEILGQTGQTDRQQLGYTLKVTTEQDGDIVSSTLNPD